MDKLIKLIKEIALIPSPTGFEADKAQFIKNWLDKRGAETAVIDEKNNVVFQYGNKKKSKIVFMAHIDTVYPIETKLEIYEDDEVVKCPSINDDSSNVAGLMLAIEHLIENKITFDNCNLVFVFSTGEEGLGNSGGCRYFMQTHDNVKEFIAVDGPYDYIISNAVGSHGYEVSVSTKGGHSFDAFGNENAIHILSKIITELYKIKLPQKEKTITTYNVGTIKGGTTVTSIAAFASILCEYRSDDNECLFYMKERFEEIIKSAQTKNCNIDVKLVGERPCSKDVNQEDHEQLLRKIEEISGRALGHKIPRNSGSTDASIPLSMGIPASSISVYFGKGNHSAKEETLFKNSLKAGMQMLMDLILSYR